RRHRLHALVEACLEDSHRHERRGVERKSHCPERTAELHAFPHERELGRDQRVGHLDVAFLAPSLAWSVVVLLDPGPVHARTFDERGLLDVAASLREWTE